MQPTADRRTVYFRGQVRTPAGEDGPPNPPGRGGARRGSRLPDRATDDRRRTAGWWRAAAAGARYKLARRRTAAGEAVAFTFNVRVDRRDEWKQLLDESYRVMKYRYYDPQMHGKDWPAIYERYLTLLEYAGTNEDVYDIANAMIGELSSSHTGRERPVERQRAARLHDALSRLRDGAGERSVSRVARLPRRSGRQGVDRHQRRRLCLVDGRRDVKAGDDYWKVLSHDGQRIRPGQGVEVRRRRGREDVSASRRSTNLTNIKYEEWVANNRDSVDKATNGQIAYVHIRAMDQPSLERFQNEIDRFWQKKGIIVDIRNNGGGNIDQELLDILERQPYQFWNNRNGSRTWGRRPRQAIVGPKVMMINYRSVSDAEVTPAGIPRSSDSAGSSAIRRRRR